MSLLSESDLITPTCSQGESLRALNKVKVAFLANDSEESAYVEPAKQFNRNLAYPVNADTRYM